MKSNSYRYHLGLWYYKNDEVVAADVTGHGKYTYSYHHTLYVAHADSVQKLAEDLAEMRCLNDRTWESYKFVIFDMHKQKTIPVSIALDMSDEEMWRVTININGLDIIVDKKRHNVEQTSKMTAEIGPSGRYELKEKNEQ